MKPILLTVLLIVTTTFIYAHPGHSALEHDIGHFFLSADHGLFAVIVVLVIALMAVRLKKIYRT